MSVPVAQTVGDAAGSGHLLPAGHGEQEEAVVCRLYVPGEHRVGAAEFVGQIYPVEIERHWMINIKKYAVSLFKWIQTFHLLIYSNENSKIIM